ncbi:MAG: DUF3095 domain-containing protein [Gammaproteobacteria bacterium]
MDSDNFYSELPILSEFSAVSDLTNYKTLPDDWHIVAADVKNSTGAIRSGLYKAVNIVGVSVITSVRNEVKPLMIPYMFGGDGATLCIPPGFIERAREALIATKLMAEKQFGLNLRVGIVPVEAVKDAGHEVLVVRHRMSEHFIQAAFAGGGVEHAENLIKDDSAGQAYRFDIEQGKQSADYSGLECRWDHVPSQRGETIALIVKALAPSIEDEAAIYDGIITKVRQIYGDDELCHPVHMGGLHLTNNNWKLSHELKIRTFAKDNIEIIKYWLFIRMQNIIGWVFMTFGLNVSDVPWGNYKKDLVSNTDFKKFDGMLREVISGTPKQREELNAYLEALYDNKKCVYGIHASDSALITCMINNRSGDHYHFVDGSNGGYAMAAAAMKERLKTLQ